MSITDEENRIKTMREMNINDFESWFCQYFGEGSNMPKAEKRRFMDCFLDARSTKLRIYNKKEQSHDALTSLRARRDEVKKMMEWRVHRRFPTLCLKSRIADLDRQIKGLEKVR